MTKRSRCIGTVVVVGMKFRVFVVKGLKDERGKRIDGWCRGDRGVLLLDSTRSPDTLLHEVVHAVDHALGLKLSEAQVHGLARGLWAAGARVVVKR